MTKPSEPGAEQYWRDARDAFQHCADHCDLILAMFTKGHTPRPDEQIGNAVVEIAAHSELAGVGCLILAAEAMGIAAEKMGFIFVEIES